MRIAALAAALLIPVAAGALEKAALPLEPWTGSAPGERPLAGDGPEVSVRYYNLCTGIAIQWIGVPPQATYGVLYDGIPEGLRLLRTHIFYAQGAPEGQGYGCLATVKAGFTDDCPGFGTLASSFFLPTTGWNTIEWSEFGTGAVPVERGSWGHVKSLWR